MLYNVVVRLNRVQLELLDKAVKVKGLKNRQEGLVAVLEDWKEPTSPETTAPALGPAEKQQGPAASKPLAPAEF
jgi:hypothetical protein